MWRSIRNENSNSNWVLSVFQVSSCPQGINNRLGTISTAMGLHLINETEATKKKKKNKTKRGAAPSASISWQTRKVEVKTYVFILETDPVHGEVWATKVSSCGGWSLYWIKQNWTSAFSVATISSTIFLIFCWAEAKYELMEPVQSHINTKSARRDEKGELVLDSRQNAANQSPARNVDK